MADKEINDLTDGGAAQAGDLVHVVRGGNSRKVALQTGASQVAIPFTAASASGPASLALAEDTDNGSNKVTLQAPSALSADATVTLPAATQTLLGTLGGTLTGALALDDTTNVTTAPPLSFDGDPNTGIGHSAADTLDLVTGGVDRFQIGSDGSQKSVIPGGSTLLPAFACRAWVNFIGTGTVAINGAGNVSSITDNGAGNYTVNFTTAMPDANYSVGGAAMRGTSAGAGTGAFLKIYPNASSFSTGSVRIGTDDGAGALVDCEYVCVQVFR